MPVKRIPFGEWLPDQPSIVGTMQDATNVIPVASGYGAFPLSSNYSNAASQTLTNLHAAKFNNLTQVFAGGTSKLFKFNAATLNLDDVSKTGAYAGSARWYFTQFGNVLLAVNDAAKVQAWTVGSSTVFADVAAAAPVAKYITTVRDFVVCANLDGGTNANKVQWSDLNDETNWTSGAASQSDFQIISDGGNIQGITGGEFGLILLERGITRMSYIGSPYFFQFDNISRGIGCVTGGSVAQYGGITYFLSDEGFYSCDGKGITPIGKEKVDRWFYNNMNSSGIDSMSAAVDPVRSLVMWNYANISGGRSLLIYNWKLGKWSTAETTTTYIASLATSGFTLEELDAFGTLDALPASLDDRIWVGGKLLLGGIATTKIVTFTGANSTASLVVGDMEEGYNSVMTLVRSQIDNGSCNVSVASRRLLDGSITYSTPIATSSENRASVRSAGRYHRVKITPTGDWTTAVTIDVNLEQQGGR